MSKSLGIFLIASEAFPLVKVDGLADVIGALPKALAKLGHQVSIAIQTQGSSAQTIRKGV
jgi:starch synthase